MGLEIKVDSHIDDIKNALDEAIETALEAIGQQAVTHAKQYISSDPVRVDTGLLRNSITFALAGKGANDSEYRPDFVRYKTKTGKTVKRTKKLKAHTYKGKAPENGKGEHAVYIGSNVEYAIYVHEGTSKMSANRFLKNAVMNHRDEYKAIAEQELKKG